MAQIYKCTKCSEYSRFTEDGYYYGLLKDKLFTDDSYITNRKIFFRCPYCYSIMDKEKEFFTSQSWQQIVLRRKKDEDDETFLERKRVLKVIRAKPIRLNLMEYYDLLSINSLSKEQELNIRVQILVLENDKRREWQNDDYEVPYNNNEINNFIELEKLLDLENGEFLFIELKRYLKKFDEATEQLKLLHDILDTKAKLYLDKFNKERILIEYKNIYVSSFFLGEEARNHLKGIRY